MTYSKDYQEKAFNLLESFANQRPGLDPRDYGGDYNCYKRESAAITKDLHDFRALMGACHWREFSRESIRKAFRSAFSGRLTLIEQGNTPTSLDYCAGQYFPTEYRKAASAVLASLLWESARQDMPEPVYVQHGSADNLPMRTEETYNGMSAGDYLRSKFRKQFSRSIAAGYFN